MGSKKWLLAVAALLVLSAAVGASAAFLFTDTDPVENVFTPGNVACVVTESFDGQTKSSVNVTVTGNTDAYVRVRLVAYRVNDAGEQIGGTAAVPAFTLGDGWFYQDGYYYYHSAVAPGEQPASPLISAMALGFYEDADGGRQVVEVLGEAIQAYPDDAAEDAWGVTAADGALAG